MKAQPKQRIEYPIQSIYKSQRSSPVQSIMFHDKHSGKRRSRRNIPASLPVAVPITQILKFCTPQIRDRSRSLNTHWDLSEQSDRQQFYHPLVIRMCPITKKALNPNIDYRKRFIALNDFKKHVSPYRKIQFDPKIANLALQKFNSRYSFIVVAGWSMTRQRLSDIVFKEQATVALYNGQQLNEVEHDRVDHQGQIVINVKLEEQTIVWEEDAKHQAEDIMINIWIKDNETDAIGLWGHYDSLLRSFEYFRDDGTAEYHSLEDWGNHPMPVSAEWTGGHTGSRYDDSTNSFPWFGLMPGPKMVRHFDDVNVEMKATNVKYKLVAPPAYDVTNYPGLDEDASYEKWRKDHPFKLSEFEISFSQFSSDYNLMRYGGEDEDPKPLKIEDLCNSVETVRWL